MKKISLLVAAAALLASAIPSFAQDRSITVASTTSTEQSGLFGFLLPKFTAKTGINVKVVAVGTGQALDIGRRGDADVVFVHDKAASGWHAPPLQPWLVESLECASQVSFGRGVAMMGEGGSIPFMGMLGEKFPRAQFVITGVLGPHSNAHGPNEFLHIPTGKKVSGVVAQVIADHAERGAVAKAA